MAIYDIVYLSPQLACILGFKKKHFADNGMTLTIKFFDKAEFLLKFSRSKRN